MTIGSAQIRKDLRLNIAYDEGKRANAPLGKIGNLSCTVMGSPKARMPGLFERFAIFWKAIFRARKIKINSSDARTENLKADQRRVQKYTSELLGKLQSAHFSQPWAVSNYGKALPSIRKTLAKLHNTMLKHKGSDVENEFYKALAAVKEQIGDARAVKAGLQYLINVRDVAPACKLAMESLPSGERKILHQIALAVDVEDEDMRGVLYFDKDGDRYKYSEHEADFELLDARLQNIMSASVGKNNQDKEAPITADLDDSEQSEIPPLLNGSNSESPLEFSQPTATNNDQSQAQN